MSSVVDVLGVQPDIPVLIYDARDWTLRQRGGLAVSPYGDFIHTGMSTRFLRRQTCIPATVHNASTAMCALDVTGFCVYKAQHCQGVLHKEYEIQDKRLQSMYSTFIQYVLCSEVATEVLPNWYSSITQSKNRVDFYCQEANPVELEPRILCAQTAQQFDSTEIDGIRMELCTEAFSPLNVPTTGFFVRIQYYGADLFMSRVTEFCPAAYKNCIMDIPAPAFFSYRDSLPSTNRAVAFVVVDGMERGDLLMYREFVPHSLIPSSAHPSVRQECERHVQLINVQPTF